MRDRSERLRRWFPLPFVAIVVLLVVLILVTPNLVTSGSPSVSSLSVEAELLVDWATTSHGVNLTHLYVRGIGTVRYTSILLSTGTYTSTRPDFNPPSSASTFNFTNITLWNDTIVAMVETPLNPVVINISAIYVDTNMNSVRFVGLYDFQVLNGALFYESYLPSPGRITSTPVSSLPLTLPLAVGP